jgi:hypothetical protein
MHGDVVYFEKFKVRKGGLGRGWDVVINYLNKNLIAFL